MIVYLFENNRENRYSVELENCVDNYSLITNSIVLCHGTDLTNSIANSLKLNKNIIVVFGGNPMRHENYNFSDLRISYVSREVVNANISKLANLVSRESKISEECYKEILNLFFTVEDDLEMILKQFSNLDPFEKNGLNESDMININNTINSFLNDKNNI